MKAAFEDLLARFAGVRVAFVGHSRLVVPDSVAPVEGEAQIFSYGLNMPVPIPDLTVTNDGISATLSFSRVPQATFVPWEAVVAVKGYGELPANSVASPKPKLSLVP